MQKVITAILTDTTVRNEQAVSEALMQQAVAVPWGTAEL